MLKVIGEKVTTDMFVVNALERIGVTHNSTKKPDLSDDNIVTLLTIQQFLKESNDKVAEKLANDIDRILEEHVC